MNPNSPNNTLKNQTTTPVGNGNGNGDGVPFMVNGTTSYTRFGQNGPPVKKSKKGLFWAVLAALILVLICGAYYFVYLPSTKVILKNDLIDGNISKISFKYPKEWHYIDGGGDFQAAYRDSKNNNNVTSSMYLSAKNTITEETAQKITSDDTRDAFRVEMQKSLEVEKSKNIDLIKQEFGCADVKDMSIDTGKGSPAGIINLVDVKYTCVREDGDYKVSDHLFYSEGYTYNLNIFAKNHYGSLTVLYMKK